MGRTWFLQLRIIFWNPDERSSSTVVYINFRTSQLLSNFTASSTTLLKSRKRGICGKQKEGNRNERWKTKAKKLSLNLFASIYTYLFRGVLFFAFREAWKSILETSSTALKINANELKHCSRRNTMIERISNRFDSRNRTAERTKALWWPNQPTWWSTSLCPCWQHSVLLPGNFPQIWTDLN